MNETPPDKGRKEPLNLNFTFDYQDFQMILPFLSNQQTLRNNQFSSIYIVLNRFRKIIIKGVKAEDSRFFLRFYVSTVFYSDT